MTIDKEGDIFYVTDRIRINLTTMYGKGNEPTAEQIDEILNHPGASVVKGKLEMRKEYVK